MKNVWTKTMRHLKNSPAAAAVTGRAPFLENPGYCPTCSQDVTFTSYDPWLRDNYFCSNCGSIPRERALMAVIEKYYPGWQNLTIHESSPINRGASVRLRSECAYYFQSQYYPDKNPGEMVGGFRCENLEALTFADESIDLHITQDVMEHIYHPSRAFQELARTLKPGGAHIFTVPMVHKSTPSLLRARLDDHGEVIHLVPPEYHGNPVSGEGSLVTVYWGYDICEFIFRATGLFTHLVYIEDTSRGIKAELNEVLVTVKPAVGSSLDGIP